MTEDEWLQKAIRAAINKDYVMTARAQHKIHLMCLVWMGMKWDSACDDSLLHAKILNLQIALTFCLPYQDYFLEIPGLDQSRRHVKSANLVITVVLRSRLLIPVLQKSFWKIR